MEKKRLFTFLKCIGYKFLAWNSYLPGFLYFL